MKLYVLITCGEDIGCIKWGKAMVEEENHPDDMLSKEEEAILRKMKEWMDHDIDAMIKGGCNVSCATLLSIFMEVLGGIAEGTLMELGKEKDRFEGFLRLNWLSKRYKTLNNTLSREKRKGFYEIFRCNLVHSYFFGGLDIENNPKDPTSRLHTDDVPGIREAEDGSGRLIINCNDLAYDIKKARDDLFRIIREGNGKYRENFRTVFKKIQQSLSKKEDEIATELTESHRGYTDLIVEKDGEGLRKEIENRST